MKKINYLSFVFFLFFAIQFSFSQKLVFGGLQGEKTIILSPKGIVNEAPTGTLFGFKNLESEEFKFQFAPNLPEDWNWIAGFNIPYQDTKTNLFFYDSWVGTSYNIKTNGRKRNFPNDITKLVKSNVYHIAFQREFMVENETFILLVSPENQKVIIELPQSVFKTKRTLTYQMKAWEAKFVHITIPPVEATTVMWKDEEVRKTISLNKDWDFIYEKENKAATWENSPFLNKKVTSKKINIPHVFNYDSHFDFRNIKDSLDIIEMYDRGTGWYKKILFAPKEWKDKYVKLNFLGVNQRADFWVNGKFCKTHIGGFTDFHQDITPFLKFDKDNEIIVRVDNRYHRDYLPHTADFDSQGGIYREVEIVIEERTLISKIWAKPTNISAIKTDIEIEEVFLNKKDTFEEVEIITNIINPYNEIIATNIQKRKLKPIVKDTINVFFPALKNPLLWSPEKPHLYRAIVILKNKKGEKLDILKQNFGIKYFNFDKDKGFSLNGVTTKLKGVNVHQDQYMKGWAADSISRKEDYLNMKKMGVNFIRMSHYPHHPHALHLADSLGMMVLEEIPVVNSVGKENFVKNALKTMEEMIIRDRNHPSIITWGVGNEYYREYFTAEETEWAVKCTEVVGKKAKKLDPFRPTIQAQNDLVDDRIMKLTDLQGRNRYFGWYTGGSAYLGFTGYDGFEKAMEIERKKYPEWKVIITEYGAEGKYGYHVNNPKRFDHSETYQIDFHKAYWNYIEKTDWIAGSTLWNMFDFTSFAKIGNIPHINQKGMMTYDRKPKSIFYYYQSKWTTEPMLYINSHTNLHRTGKITEKQPVEIFSNLDEIELFVNGKSIGVKQKSTDWIWNVDLKEGFNDLKAIGKKDGHYLSENLRIHFSEITTKTTNKSGNDSD
jgi:beta-galactosidase